jgi:hypothetical protein
MDDNGGAMGTVLWIGALVLFNVLSYTFHWGWIVY